MLKQKIFSLVLCMVMALSASFSVSAESNNSVYGDVNGDGTVNINDVTAIQKHCVQLKTFSYDQYFSADFNCDAYVDVNDCTALQKYLVDLEKEVFRPAITSIHGEIPENIGVGIEYNVKVENDVRGYSYGKNVEEFSAVIRSYEEYIQLFDNPKAEFNRDFFEENSLIFLYRYENYSSDYYEINSVSVDGDTIYTSYTGKYVLEGMQAQLGHWNIYVTVKKADIGNTEKMVLERNSERYYWQ